MTSRTYEHNADVCSWKMWHMRTNFSEMAMDRLCSSCSLSSYIEHDSCLCLSQATSTEGINYFLETPSSVRQLNLAAWTSMYHMRNEDTCSLSSSVVVTLRSHGEIGSLFGVHCRQRVWEYSCWRVWFGVGLMLLTLVFVPTTWSSIFSPDFLCLNLIYCIMLHPLVFLYLYMYFIILLLYLK